LKKFYLLLVSMIVISTFPNLPAFGKTKAELNKQLTEAISQENVKAVKKTLKDGHLFMKLPFWDTMR